MSPAFLQSEVWKFVSETYAVRRAWAREVSVFAWRESMRPGQAYWKGNCLGNFGYWWRHRPGGMKLDPNALRYMSKEEYRTLQAVELGQKNVSADSANGLIFA
jgi:hypothetical protein